MKTTRKNKAVENYKQIDSLIRSVSNLTDCERIELAKSNIWALLSNIEIIN